MLFPAINHALTVDFCGYVKISDGSLLFAFKNREKRVSSAWLRVGQRWDGWTLVAFDQQSESVELASAESKVRLTLVSSTIETPASLPSFEGGNFTLSDGTVIYSHEAVLHLGSLRISSPSGVMVSDKLGEQVSGDLVLETPEGEFKTSEALVRLVDGRSTIVAKSMSFSPRKAQ